jgi:hypothetical protein
MALAAPAPASSGDPLPTLLTAALQDDLATLAAHADEEAVGALPSAVVGLERPLHRWTPIFACGRRSLTADRTNSEG